MTYNFWKRRLRKWLLNHTSLFSGHSPNGIYDLDITRTSTNIAADSPTDFLLGGIRIFVQKAFGRQYHAWRAKSALNGPLLDKGLLKGMKCASGLPQPFDGDYLTAVGHDSRDQAGAHRPAIQ
jgi:hypothetical protein